MSGEQLGTAELELGADLAPLDRDLAKAERRVAASVAVMQRMLDSLHLDPKVAGLVAGGAAGPGGATIIREQGGAQKTVTSGSEVWGIRGPQHPGSLTNPIVMVQAAAKFFPMGSYGAAVGEDNASDVQRGDSSSGIASAAEMAALTSAVQDLARNASPGSRLATVGASGMGEPQSGERAQVVLDDQDGRVLRDMAACLAKIEQRATGTSSDRTVLLPSRSGSGLVWAGPNGHGSSTGGPMVLTTVGRGSSGGGSGPVTIIQSGGGSGGGGMVPVALAGAGGGGGRRVDVFYHRPDGAGGGGGAAGGGLLGGLGWGGGIAGMAAAGSVLSFAGLGAEHILTTILGVLGSATAAAGGGGLLALGSLGKLGVGGGSDLAAMRETISNVKQLNQAYSQLATAQATYGNNSKQAQQAQQQLNGTLRQLSQSYGPAAAAAMNQVSLATQKLGDQWDKALAPAIIQATHILNQAIGLAHTFIPLIGGAATTNLGIISRDLQPLFAWLQGPQGIQIFNDLENAFAKDLPTAVHAGSQALELLLRVIDIASQDTGGFVGHLDHLFTRLNSMDSARLGQDIGRLVGDFRLWDHFIVLLVGDIYRLFHQDVGTGNSIIGALTGMLEKLKLYEQSSRGQAELQNIFMVHKTEVLDLLHILEQLALTFSHIYMGIAPSAVTVMNDVVLPVLDAVAKALAAIAHSSPLAADALGALLIGAKFGGWKKTVGLLAGGTQFLLGTGGKAAAGAAGASALATTAEGAGGAALATGLPGAIEGGSLALGGGLEALGLGGLGLGLVGAGGALAAALPIVIPVAVAGVAAYILGHDVLGIGKQSPISAGPGGVQGFRAANVGRTGGQPGRPGASTTPLSAAGQLLNVQEVGNFANYSATQLAALIKEMKQADGLQLNGINVPKNQLIALAQAALKAKDAWNRSFNDMWAAVNRFYLNNSRTLPALYDDFNTVMRRIASTMGLNSDQGRKAVAANVARMVEALRAGMGSGQISVKDGMRAMRQILGQGMADQAITWRTDWTAMMSTVDSLYAHHKITTGQYLAEVRSITDGGWKSIRADIKASLSQQLADLKTARDRGVITDGQYHAKVHQAQLAANTQQAVDMAAWVGNLDSAMKASGALTAKGMQVITAEVNQALGLFGGAKLPIPQAIAWLNWQQSGASMGPHQAGAHATGGKITTPLIMVGEEAPTHPEFVLATNPAYRERNVNLWAMAGRELGIPGFATGGITPPSVGGAGGLAAVVRGALAYDTRAANAFLGTHAPKGGGGGGAPGGAHHGGSASAGGAYNSAQLASLWVAAGGPPGVAHLMASIALAESGGNPAAYNASGASGLWQILGVPFPGNPFDPATNARMAVAKYLSQGLGAWVTYTSGAYKAYYARGGIIGRLMRFQTGGGWPVPSGGWQQPMSHHGAGGGGGIPNWFPVGISNSAISANLSGISNEFQGFQTMFGNVSSLASILQSLKPGTNLAKVGLSGAAVKASGLTLRQIGALIGGGPGGFAALQNIDQGEIDKYQVEIKKLKQLYRDALHNHNKKLANAILGEISALDTAVTQAISDKQAAMIAELQAKAQQYSDQASAVGNSLSTLQGIEGLAPGTNLAALGLSPQILATLGLNASNLGGLTGSSLSYFQQLAQSQGGSLTSAQIAQAQSGVNAQNSLLSQQMSPLENELSYYQSVLPSLSGQNKTDAISTMQGLAQSILQLQSSIDTNTQGLSQLTTATNANTTATASMTGTVAYVFNGQGYTASMASDTTTNLGVGG